MLDVRSTGGFASLREFYGAIRAAQFDGVRDPRLISPTIAQRGPTGLNEVDPTAGGFLVPQQWADGFLGSLYDESVIAPLTWTEELTGPLVEFNLSAVDETNRANGSRWGGVQAYWSSEASTISASLPHTRRVSFGPKKLIGFMWATNELLADSALFEAFARKAFASEIGFKLDAAILSGTGAGTPGGILSSSGLITVAKEAGQAAASLYQVNISKMWARLPAPSRKRAVWLVNEDVESTLDTLNVGDRPQIYTSAGTAGNPLPLLKGRPVITADQCPALGTVGDIVLADLTQYLTVTGAPQYALSADAGFLSDQSVMRFTLRVDGQPLWTSPITPANGTSTRSPFVALAAR